MIIRKYYFLLQQSWIFILILKTRHWIQTKVYRLYIVIAIKLTISFANLSANLFVTEYFFNNFLIILLSFNLLLISLFITYLEVRLLKNSSISLFFSENFYQYYEVRYIRHYTRAPTTCSVNDACRSLQNLALEANANDTFRAAYLFLAFPFPVSTRLIL